MSGGLGAYLGSEQVAGVDASITSRTTVALGQKISCFLAFFSGKEHAEATAISRLNFG